MAKIVGLVGFADAGKGSASRILVEKHNCVADAFAGPVKDACAVIFGWSRELLEGDTKESREFREAVDTYWSTILDWPDFTPRIAMQYEGTEGGRNVFGEALWVGSLVKRVTGRNESGKGTVVTDVRFPNEIVTVRNMRGLVVRVKRGPEPAWYATALDWNKHTNWGTEPTIATLPAELDPPKGGTHMSEWAWIGHPLINVTIENDGTLEDLEKKVESILL